MKKIAIAAVVLIWAVIWICSFPAVAVWAQAQAYAQAQGQDRDRDRGLETQTPTERLEPIPPPVPVGPEPRPEPGGEGPISLTATGRASWLVKYGIGDARGLIDRGYATQFLLEQALSLDAEGGVRVEWPLSGTISISAHLDNQKAENLQLLSIRYLGRDLEGEFGDFTVAGNTAFTGYDKKLKGFRLEWTPGEDLSVRGVFSRVEGLPQVRVFRGNTSPAEVTYMLHEPERPWVERSYSLNIRGLEYYRISGFVPGFTKLRLAFRPDEGLKGLLGGYGLGYLFSTIKEAPQKEVDSSDYLVVNKEGEQFLILRREVIELLRWTLKGYIDDYNEARDLSGEERKEYPLDEGSEYELGFLRKLVTGYVLFDLDGTDLRLDGYERERFYYLGYQDIDPGSVEVEVKLGDGDGDGEFTPITDPSLIDYDYHLFPEEGIIELSFPASFFADLEENQIRINFNYAVSGGMYILGLSIVQGSEKVYLNGELLERDLDYTIDYETGALFLFRELGPEDELRIEYEISRGGLGGVTDYERSLAGLLVKISPTDFLTLSFDLLRAADSPAIGDDSTLQTMPNDHIVGGLSAKLDLGDLQGALEFGYNYNRFPFDDNQRKNLPNRINVIRSLSYHEREYILFGEQNGLAIFDPAGGKWRVLGPGEGLAGRAVRDIALAEGNEILVIATDSGISILRLEGEDPFAILTNWRRFYQQDGLPSQDTYAVLIQDGSLYVGTAAGLARVPLGKIEEEGSWEVYRKETHPQMVSERITSLAGDGELVYLGTDGGLMLLDPRSGELSAPPELTGVLIHDLLSVDREVLVATELGIRVYSRGRGMGWLSTSTSPAITLALFAGEVWYGTDEGVWQLGVGDDDGDDDGDGEAKGPLLRAKVTALGGSSGGLWVGTEADVEADYDFPLWRIDPAGSVRTYTQWETRLDGKDRYHFIDIPAKEHTDWGPALSLSLSQKLGKLRLTAGAEWLSPEFIPLGSKDRRDLRGWSLAGSYEFSPRLRLGLKHEAKLKGAETGLGLGRRYSETESINLEWKIGPELTLGYSLERIDDRGEKDGFDKVRHGLEAAVRGSLLEDRLGLLFSFKQASLTNLRWADRTSRDIRLVGEATLHLPLGVELLLRYDRLMKISRYGELKRSWGSEVLDFSLSWNTLLPWASLQAEYNRDSRRRLPAEGREAELEHSGRLDLEFTELRLGGLALYPRGAVFFHQEEGRLSLAGEGGLRGEFREIKAQGDYKLRVNLNKWTRRKEFLNNLSLRLDYSGWKGLTPEIALQGTVRLLQHPIYGRKVLESWTMTASLGWKATLADLTLSNNLALSRRRAKEEREDTVSYSLRNTTGLKIAALPRLSLTLEANGSYIHGERNKEPLDGLDLELILKGDYKLKGNWSATALIGYVLNIDNLDAEGSYQSLYLSAQIGTTF